MAWRGKEEVGADRGGPAAAVELFLEGDEGIGGMDIEDLDFVFIS